MFVICKLYITLHLFTLVNLFLYNLFKPILKLLKLSAFKTCASNKNAHGITISFGGSYSFSIIKKYIRSFKKAFRNAFLGLLTNLFIEDIKYFKIH